MPSLFGTSGVRGPAVTLFTPQFCFDLGRAFAYFLDVHNQKGTIAIGIDTRSSSPHIAQNLIYGLRHAGREVIHLGVIPVPVANHVLLTQAVIASLMVTGSHIDITSNGVKFFAFREEITKLHEAEITDYYHQVQQQIKPQAIYGVIPQNSAGLNNYLELLLSLVDHPLNKLKIVFDPGNGAQTQAIGSLLREIDLDHVSINSQIQEPLISRDTETEGVFRTLSERVIQERADLGVGFDSDGDRIVFVDSTGRVVPGDYTGTILASWFANETVVCPVNVSNVINHIGKEVIRTKVGSPYVIEGMKKYAANFGFESNGGCIHADIMHTRDGGTTFVKMLNLLKWSKKSLSQLIDELPRFYIRRAKFDCPTDKFQQILDHAKKFQKAVHLDETDGVKLILDTNTWVLFRPSGNAPEFRLFVESNLETKANQLLDHALSFAKRFVST